MRLALLGLAALACGKRPPLSWTAPASSGVPAAACRPAHAELGAAFAEGIHLPAQEVAALFPDLALHASWVARVEITSHRVEQCGIFVVLEDPNLRFLDRRDDPLEAALVTEVLVHPRMILSLQREALQPPPPTGAWLAPDRTTLRHVGPVIVGTVE